MLHAVPLWAKTYSRDKDMAKTNRQADKNPPNKKSAGKKSPGKKATGKAPQKAGTKAQESLQPQPQSQPQPSLQLLPGKKMWPISNSYVFAKVMQEHANLCQHLAERLIGQKIKSIEKLEAESVENTILSRGVRFDACLEGSGSLVDMEMQTVDEANLVLRNAYYQAWLTRRALKKGEKISSMPKRFVIFICSFDPLDRGEALYWIRREARGESGMPYDIDDGEACLMLNTKAYRTCKTARIAGVLKYIETGKINEGDNLMTYLEDARIGVHNDEDWVRGMNITELDKLEWEDIILERGRKEGIAKGIDKGRAEGRKEGRASGIAEGIDKGRAEGQSAERLREAALLEAMSEQGRDTSEFVNAVANNNLDTLYQKYGIE